MSATKQNYERQIPPMKFINGNMTRCFAPQSIFGLGRRSEESLYSQHKYVFNGIMNLKRKEFSRSLG